MTKNANPFAEDTQNKKLRPNNYKAKLIAQQNDLFSVINSPVKFMSLLEKKISLPDFNINILNEEGTPLLFCAYNSEKIGLIKELINRGADINVKNAAGENILAYIVNGQYMLQYRAETVLKTVQELFKKNINIESVNSQGQSFPEVINNNPYFPLHLKQSLISMTESHNGQANNDAMFTEMQLTVNTASAYNNSDFNYNPEGIAPQNNRLLFNFLTESVIPNSFLQSESVRPEATCVENITVMTLNTIHIDRTQDVRLDFVSDSVSQNTCLSFDSASESIIPNPFLQNDPGPQDVTYLENTTEIDFSPLEAERTSSGTLYVDEEFTWFS